MIKFQCDNCGQKFKVDDKFAGKKGKCHKCGKSIAIPEQANQEGTQHEITYMNFGDDGLSKNRVQLLVKVLSATLVIILLGVAIFFKIRERIEVENAMQWLHESYESMVYYKERGLESPSIRFQKSIPDMKDLLRQTQAVEIELKAISRNLEVGANYNEYKMSILKLGTACDSILNVSDCSEASGLVRKAESALRYHKDALDSWGMYIKYTDHEYITKRGERIDEALKASSEFLDYCDYIRIAIKYESQPKK